MKRTCSLLILLIAIPVLALVYHPAVTNQSQVVMTTTADILGLSSLRTITNATDTTWSQGAGLICWDTNYLYLSVGTNQWKRVALSGW